MFKRFFAMSVCIAVFSFSFFAGCYPIGSCGEYSPKKVAGTWVGTINLEGKSEEKLTLEVTQTVVARAKNNFFPFVSPIKSAFALSCHPSVDVKISAKVLVGTREVQSSVEAYVDSNGAPAFKWSIEDTNTYLLKPTKDGDKYGLYPTDSIVEKDGTLEGSVWNDTTEVGTFTVKRQ